MPFCKDSYVTAYKRRLRACHWGVTLVAIQVGECHLDGHNWQWQLVARLFSSTISSLFFSRHFWHFGAWRCELSNNKTVLSELHLIESRAVREDAHTHPLGAQPVVCVPVARARLFAVASQPVENQVLFELVSVCFRDRKKERRVYLIYVWCWSCRLNWVGSFPFSCAKHPEGRRWRTMPSNGDLCVPSTEVVNNNKQT